MFSNYYIFPILGEEDKANLLGDELAAKLSEPKTQLMIGIVEIVGVDVALDLFNKTKDIESKGGMMIKNGERRRTPGGVFMQLLRDAGTYIDICGKKSNLIILHVKFNEFLFTR